MSNISDPNANSKPQREISGARRRSAAAESGADVMGRTETVLREVPHSPALDATDVGPQKTRVQIPDPAPSAPAIAEEQAQQLITNISTLMLGELRSLREQLDGLMRDMNERREMISEAIRSHAEFVETAIQHKVIIAESMAKLQTEFEASRTPLPPVRNIHQV